MKTDSFKLTPNGSHVVRFHSPTCGPCRQLEPIFDKLTLAHPDINFYSIDVTSPESSLITSELGIRSVPTVVCISNGGIKDILVGPEAANPNRLNEAVKELKSRRVK